MNHKNNDIRKLGTEITLNYFDRKKITHTKYKELILAKIDGIECLVDINTKRATRKGLNELCTGKNVSSLIKLQENAKLIQRPIFLIFVDCKDGTIHGGSLDYLKKDSLVVKARGQEIEYFPVRNLQYLDKIPADQLEELQKLTFANKEKDKGQLLIL